MQKLSSVALLLLGFAMASCGAASAQRPAIFAPGTGIVWSGTLRFEARTATPRGLSQDPVVRPARFVDVLARDAAGAEVARTATTEEGTFSLSVPPTATMLVMVAHAHQGTHDIGVSSDALGRTYHELLVPIAGLASHPVELIARDDDRTGSGGAFHIVDTLLRGLDAATRWSGRELPPIFVYWSRGGPSDWSYYRGERPAASGRFALELMGGEPGRVTSTDTDEHDEAIILHELGHFVFDRLTSDSSIGGLHPAGTLIDPGVAWEEGRASWFATSVLGRPAYQDTIGREPGGSLRVNHDLEVGFPGPTGAGSETAVSEVLWDLSDGAEGIPDADNDGLAIGPAGVLRAMIALAQEPGAIPELAGFLRYLVRTNAVAALPLKQMLARGMQPPSLVPEGDIPTWPRTVALPARAVGKIDGVTSPAPSGGPARPENGIDAVHAYRFQVVRPGFLVAQLRVLGSGRAADHEDVDLELRSIRAEMIISSRGETPTEHIGRVLEPGWYTIFVRDGGNGNRVGYELNIALE